MRLEWACPCWRRRAPWDSCPLLVWLAGDFYPLDSCDLLAQLWLAGGTACPRCQGPPGSGSHMLPPPLNPILEGSHALISRPCLEMESCLPHVCTPSALVSSPCSSLVPSALLCWLRPFEKVEREKGHLCERVCLWLSILLRTEAKILTRTA